MICFFFWRHLCSYKVLLLNYWSTPIITICCFSISDCKNHLRMIHFCSNESISIILSITLVNTRDLAHCATWALLLSIWKQKYYFPGGGFFFDWHMQVYPKWYMCWCCSYKWLVNWWSDTVTIFLGVSNYLESSSTATFEINSWSFFYCLYILFQWCQQFSHVQQQC